MLILVFVFVFVFAFSATLFFIVARNVLIVVPAVFYKIYRMTTGIVFMAVLTPFFFVPGWYVQVNRLANYAYRLLDDYRLGVDQLRPRKITNFDVTVKAGLTNTDCDTDISCERRGGHGGHGDQKQKLFHGVVLFVRVVTS